MKKIVFALSALAVLLTACSKDFINPRHNSSEPLDEYFNTPERLFQCLVAAYDPLEWYDYAFGQYDNLHLIFDVMGDDVYAGGSNEGDQTSIVKTHYYTATSTDQPNQIWTVNYSGINRAATLIKYVDGAEGVSEETKKLYVAEAKVLMAYYYNMLWKLWGNIPYWEELLEAPYIAPQLGHDEVYANFIKLLEDAIGMDVLPMKAKVGDEGRVTKAMAYMLYAEAVLYQNDQSRYQTALNYMKEIISSGQYSLVSDFAGIWEESGEWCAESIWEINYISEGGVRDWGSSIATGGQVNSILTGIPAPKNVPDYHEGWGFGTIAKSAYDMYDDDDIRRDGGILNFDAYAKTLFEKNGVNMDLYPTAIKKGKTEDEKKELDKAGAAYYVERWQDTGFWNRKYIAREGGNHGYKASDNLNYGNNERIYRYAETLLNAAELSVLLGQDGSAYLQQVRDRAHCHDTGVSREDIIQERHKEFVGEGKRYWDLVRSGLAPTVLKAANHEWRQNDWTENKKYWPIPQSEIDKDPSLEQNNY